MNRIKILSIAMLAAAVVFSSCNKDDDEPDVIPSGPSLTLSETSFEGWYGDVIDIAFTISSNDEITGLEVTPSTNDLNSISFDADSLSGDFFAEGSVQYVLPSGGNWDDGDSFTISFVATNEVDGDSFTTTQIVTVTYVTPVDPLTEFTGIINNLIGPDQGAWNLELNEGVSSSEDDGIKDMRNTTTNSSGAPEIFETEWDSPANTSFVLTSLTSADYDAMTPTGILVEYNAGTPVGVVSNVQEGQIYVADIRGNGAYTIIRIDQVNVTSGDNADFISFSYKK